MKETEKTGVGIKGFSDGIRYQSARPGYPVEAVAHLVDHLAIDASTKVVDVAAGTGLFTRELVAFTSHVIAVEPARGMRDELVVQLPSVEVLDGVAEKLPLGDNSADVLTVAQAFHWFDPDEALGEFARVLVRGGGLGLIWNERDESVQWVDAMSKAILWHQRKPYDMATDFGAILLSGGFVDVEKRTFRNVQLMDRLSLHERVLSTSYIAMMSPQEQKAILKDVDDIIASFEESFELPYVTTTFCARSPLH
jgi:ubiquinone/menaquinone biosynthesis C-methylase UbiE